MKAAKDLDGDYKFYTLHPTKKIPYKARRGGCQGGYECTNAECEDMTGDGTKNTSSFLCRTNSIIVTCKMCKLSKFVKHHPCNATRTVLLPEGTADAWIVDEGQHLSTCKSLKTRLSSASAISQLHDELNCGPKKVKLSRCTHFACYVQFAMLALLAFHESIIICMSTSWDVLEHI